MSKEIYISSTPHETRLAIVESDELTEIYYERENEYTLAGSIYNGRVTRVLPGMQSSFVDIGLERDAFLYITDFMEDEADTAEFDHTGDATPRPARVEGQRNDRGGERNGQRGERNGGDGRGREAGGERSGGYVSERNQEQASATPASDMARASEGRSEENGGRGDRNGRGRGRRDRGGRGERSGGVERPLDRETGSRFGEASPVPQPALGGFEDEEVILPVDVAAPAADAGVELGEGAPGADGSRRWRGRRGRRRGRGTGTREGGGDSQVEGAESGPEDVEVAQTSANVVAEPAFKPLPMPADEVRVEEPAREGRQRGRDGRGERGGRPQAELRVPRGFAPRKSLYGVESEPEEMSVDEPIGSLAASGSEPEPLILPGETLSKYRKGGQEAGPVAETRVSASAASVDSGFKVDPNWDGGAMLPGETLSRYRGGSPQAASEGQRTDGRGDRDRSSRENRGRGRRDGRDAGSRDRFAGGADRQQNSQESGSGREIPTPMMVPAESPAVDLQSGGPVPGYVHMNEQGEELQAFRPDFTHSELPEATAEAPRMEDGGLAHSAGTEHHGEIERIDAAQSEQEYEPEGQSASYRVDPAPPSEYRLQGGVAQAEEEAVAPAHAEVALSGEVFAPVVEAQGHTEAGSAAVLTALPAGLSALQFGARAQAASPQTEEEATEAHEMTTVDATGAMHSEAPVVHPFESGGQDFAPGAGDLEEDFIEEEEIETANLYAQSDDEFDDLEEEHLEGTADLGSMIRDMTVDQITRANGGVDEGDEDFEEDQVEQGFEDTSESAGERESFAAQPGRGFEEETGDERRSAAVEPSGARDDGYSRPASGDRRGRDNGRRGGRDRNGGRESGSRFGQSDRGNRGGSGETNGYASERSGPDRSGLGERARNTGGASDRDRGRSNGRGGRQSAQMTNLPAISDLLKPGQEILCQIAKEPIAKKGARITSHIALPGRFLVFMPTVSHTGVSRKIESDQERRRLKEILMSEKGEAAGGFIVRTAAAGASEEELRSDLRFLLNLWSDIKQRSESSKSPALIYHDLNLVERILRDQVTDNFSAIWVDTETEYERVLRFLQRFQPGLIRRVKLYTKETPLFEQFGITEEINKALRSKVWLKSGGSIVINQTEALVAIDINTGKYVGKTARLEDTIVKTNLDAIPEIVRQIRLRDLGGIIIIDFIDMDERKNRNRVMQALEDELKNDRAPSKVLPFNDFGLVAITRKRVKQSLERTLSTTCGVCTGTGMVKSPVTVCNDIYVEMRKMHKHLDRGDVMLRVHPEVVKQLKSTGTRWLQEMEEMCGKTILIKSDPALHPEQFDIH